MEQETIQVIVNGYPEPVPAKASIDDLIRLFEEEDVHLIVELNGAFVYPGKYSQTLVTQGDRVEFINPNFGG